MREVAKDSSITWLCAKTQTGLEQAVLLVSGCRVITRTYGLKLNNVVEVKSR